MPVTHMKSIMSHREFEGWMLYLDTKYPEITELQLATLSSLVSTGLGGKQKTTDFIISKTPDTKAKTQSEGDTIGMSTESVRSAFSGIAVPMK